MKEPLVFSKLHTVAGQPVATVISDFRQRMDNYDPADAPPHHADRRWLLLIGPERAEQLASMACAEDLMRHDWAGGDKLKIQIERLAGQNFAVIMPVRQAANPGETAERPIVEVMLADVETAEGRPESTIWTPEERFDPKLAKLGRNYYGVGPVYFGTSKKPKPHVLGYTTRAVVVEGLEASDVWPIILPERPQ